MKQRPWWFTGLQFTGLGWYIAGAIVLPTLGGLWLDKRVGTTPLFLLLGLLLGVILAFYGTYKMAVSFTAGLGGSPKDKGP